MQLRQGGPFGHLVQSLCIAGAAIIAAAMPALAHEGPDRQVIQGLIIASGDNVLQVQTMMGAVTVPLARTTHVVRLVAGSSADVTPGKRVKLHLRGPHTVDALSILQPKPAPTRRPDISTPTKTGSRDTHTTRPTQKAPIAIVPSGQVVSLNGNTLTLHCDSGQTRTYTLTPNVSVTKALTGSLNDLAVGEIVQVLIPRPGAPAASVTIINA
ncbi:MAG TPA: hypothetical protein VF221_04035 [Chloroflexota bacterium]